MNNFTINKERRPVAIIGATGMVGQRFVDLLADHPWYRIVAVAASPNSAGKTYMEAVEGRWSLDTPVPDSVRNLTLLDVEKDKDAIAGQVDLVFSAVAMDKAAVRAMEIEYAARELAVISNNSAHRWTPDVPMMMPEINPHHAAVIEHQRKNRGWNKGLIAVKPNCSIQSYVPVFQAFWPFGVESAVVTMNQAVSGAGKSMETWPEMQDNVIPLIPGEEKKSEDEPLKIWGSIVDGKIEQAQKPHISATCIRVPVSDGHMASVHVKLGQNPSKEALIEAINTFKNPLAGMQLPSSPETFMKYFEDDDRPQTATDRDFGNGMSITVGRLRQDNVMDWKFIALSHNTLRGAAGGGVLTAEFLTHEGYI